VTVWFLLEIKERMTSILCNCSWSCKKLFRDASTDLYYFPIRIIHICSKMRCAPSSIYYHHVKKNQFLDRQARTLHKVLAVVKIWWLHHPNNFSVVEKYAKSLPFFAQERESSNDHMAEKTRMILTISLFFCWTSGGISIKFSWSNKCSS